MVVLEELAASVGNNRLTDRLIDIQKLIDNRIIVAQLINTTNFLQYLIKNAYFQENTQKIISFVTQQGK